MADLYNWINPKTGKHAPMISEETYNVIMKNADVSSFFVDSLQISDFFFMHEKCDFHVMLQLTNL